MVRTIRRSYFGVFAVMASMALLCVLAGSSGAAAGDTTRVNLDSLGTQAEGSGSGTPSISADGRFVAFTSSTTNLVAGDTNGVADVFVRDRDTDNNGVMDEAGKTSTERVSVDSSETQANARSLFRPSISADGRFVAFHSEASNLVPGDTNQSWDVFVRDLQEETTERVSVDSSGNQGNNHSSSGDFTSISSDGRYVAFSSDATNLVPSGSPGGGDIYVRDRTAGKTERVNLANGSMSSVSNGYDFRPSISGDGRYVAWISSASNLVTGDTNTGVAPGYDVFVRDRTAGTTERVSVDSLERQASLGAACQFFCSPNQVSDVSISSDGRYVAWSTSASDLVAGDTNGLDDIFVRDRTAGTTDRVSLTACGAQANDGSFTPSISADGRYVVFTSGATNLVPDDTNATYDVFVRDLQGGTTERVNVSSSGTQTENGGGGSGDLSADGRYATFSSGATNLVPDDTNNLVDIFVHERGGTLQRPSDCTPPTTTASATTPEGVYTSGTWTTKDVKITFSAQDDGGSGVKEIRYSASGAQSIPETAYDPQSLPIINTEGTTTITYFATDNAGNQESPKTFTIKLDKSAPDTTITSGPSGTVSSTSASFSFSSSEAASTFQCSRDGASFAACTSPKSYSSLSQGNHTFQVRAIDKAGNVDPTPASRSWFVDTVVPKGTVVINGGVASTSSRTVTLKLSASDPSPASGVASMRFKNGGTTTWSSWFDYTTSKSWTLSAGAGTKTVYVQYNDRAGNISAAASDTIRYTP